MENIILIGEAYKSGYNILWVDIWVHALYYTYTNKFTELSWQEDEL